MKDVAKVEKKEVDRLNEKKKEIKLKDDSGYNCNYCNGYNHLAKDSMLRKKEKVKAYNMKKLEEICSRIKNISLIARGNDE